jgi:hypothetical protein
MKIICALFEKLGLGLFYLYKNDVPTHSTFADVAKICNIVVAQRQLPKQQFVVYAVIEQKLSRNEFRILFQESLHFLFVLQILQELVVFRPFLASASVRVCHFPFSNAASYGLATQPFLP